MEENSKSIDYLYDFEEESIGFNIKDIRKNVKPESYTVKFMVSEINKLLPKDRKITEALYYKWECEERVPTAKQIPAIAKVLGVSENALFHWQRNKALIEDDAHGKFEDELMSLDIERINKFVWLMSGWEGDRTALIEFALLYANLTVADRRDLAAFGIRLFDICKKEGRVEEDIPKPDEEYLRKALKKLWWLV